MLSQDSVAVRSDAERALTPKRRDDVVGHAVADELVLWDGLHETAVSLNLTAAAVWELCDGSTSVAEMVRDLSGIVGRDPSELEQDVERAVRELRELGLLTPPLDGHDPAEGAS